jgi:hypothetical protein
VEALHAQLFLTSKVGQDPVRRFENILHLNRSVAESVGSSSFEFRKLKVL